MFDEEQMIEVDRIMIEDLRIELIQMMENAGRNLASLVIERFAPATVTVLAGPGGNGGGGLVAADVVSLDTPSGLNVTDGSAPGSVVMARATLTLALPKVGLRNAAEVGELYVADISVPPSVYPQVGVAVGLAPPFDRGPIVHCG